MKTAYPFQSGYDAYWDGYSFHCMDDILFGAQLKQWKRGYEKARKEDKGR